MLGPLALTGTADARVSDSRVSETQVADGTEQPTRPVAPEGPDAERPDTERPNRDFEVLQMHCDAADGAEDDTRIHIGCRWRAAEHEKAAGYQLWRIVDRGERELVARGGLDMLGARDVVAADTSVVRYAVVAVNEDGRRVGQSRVQRIVLDDHDSAEVARRTRANRVGNRR